ncbi:helix-turn-helix domain-containing protein [Parapedobacter soli]|uniref:helix-turn-helix domain-containing protein n=1 Tax=Parapedobacter soli TaxID=416955 RepID=UPI0021C8C97D|nr:helix-turn-helix domain-containing protein [Parapedobacter soli]
MAKTIKQIYDKQEMTVAQIAKTFHIGRTTCYRYINYINGIEKLTKKENQPT